MSDEPTQVKVEAQKPVTFGYRYSCSLCLDSGAVMARSLEHPDTAPWVFRCTCHVGQYKARNAPPWDRISPNRFEAMKS